MQNNFYENLKQLDNASSNNNNNNNPPYENSAIIQKYQQEDLNSNKPESLYAVVHKNGNSSSSKNVPSLEIINNNILNNNQLKTSSTIESIPCMTGSSSQNSNMDVYSKVWKGPKKDLSTRMWTCSKCSYAYNALWVDNCDICDTPRSSPAQKSSTKTSQIASKSRDNFNNNKLAMSKSTHGFDECLPSVRVPMASFEQDLEDDFQFLPAESPTIEESQPTEWTCKKCTLVNSGKATVCIVCGGSKLKSTTAIVDMTLRKGEFWTCSACTLKNSLGTNICVACKAIRPIPNITKPSNFRPYTGSSPSSTPTTPKSLETHLPPKSQLLVPSTRIHRSPSPRHESGAIPKRHSTGSGIMLPSQSASSALTRSGSGHGSHSSSKHQQSLPVTWICPACTFENPSASVVCDICSSNRRVVSETVPSNIR